MLRSNRNISVFRSSSIITIMMLIAQVYTKMMHSGLEEGVAAVERERARVIKIIGDKVIFIILFMMRSAIIIRT